MQKPPGRSAPTLGDVVNAIALCELDGIHTAEPEAQVKELREVLYEAFSRLSKRAKRKFFKDVLVAHLLNRLKDVATEETP